MRQLRKLALPMLAAAALALVGCDSSQFVGVHDNNIQVRSERGTLTVSNLSAKPLSYVVSDQDVAAADTVCTDATKCTGLAAGATESRKLSDIVGWQAGHYVVVSYGLIVAPGDTAVTGQVALYP